jgi:hypothetical protein
MRTGLPPTSGVSHSHPSDAQPTIGSSYLLGLAFLALLVAVSYPVVTLAVCFGALAPTLARRGRAVLATLRTPSSATTASRNRRGRRELSD